MALIPGTRLGPYEIESPLGAGGMGEVYRARDTRLNRDVAVKILPASFSADPEQLQRFAQESRAAAALNHPNILSIFDIGEANGAPYVVSELLEGETLRDRLRNGPLSSTRKAIDYAQQIARGLAAAHERGIIHRDLKPENLFITHDGRVKILDFGLAKFTRPEVHVADDAPTMQVATEAGTVLGTAGYMAPEQVRGKATDARSDIFSFGAILYEMLSGKRAFHGDSAADTMTAILKEDPPDLNETNRNISPAFDRIVRHCLEKSPAERFQSARDVAFNLEALSDVSTSTRGGMRALPVEEGKPLRRWLIPLVAAALAALVVASWIGVYRYARRGVEGANPTFHEITFRNGTIQQARFAPDGQTIIYGAAWDGRPQELFTTHFDSTDSRSMGLPTAQILSISSKEEMAIMLHPITAVSLECGYSASAIRERIYAGESGYGILLHTGTQDSEGTLGGLVQVGRKIETHLRNALELGRLCSNDPVCAQHNPQDTHEERYLMGAACHGCVLIAETSCERFNQYLDRSLVVPNVATSGTEFFDDAGL